MNGLILKDFYVIKNYMNSKYLILLFLGYLFTFFISPASGSFLSAWIFIILSMFTITSMAYDERSGWNGYALSMPISRRMIVKSKYLFALLLVLIGAVLSLLFILIFALINQQNGLGGFLPAWLTALFISILLNSILIPVNFKYGTEKGRNVLLLLAIVPAGIVILIGKAPILPRALLEKAAAFFLYYKKPLLNGLAWAAVIIPLLILLVSYFISVRIVKKKEF